MRVETDLLVAGGGIVGAGVLREARLRGLQAYLAEAGDFGGGTTSKTSRLVHGGLRYLEHGEIGLVREALAERNALLRIAPHLLEKTRFLVPFLAGRGRAPILMKAGLSLYDLLGGSGLGPHQILSPEAVRERLPGAPAEAVKGGGTYGDLFVRPERLAVETIADAVARGAVAASRARLVRLLVENGRIAGGIVERSGPLWEKAGAAVGRTEEIEVRAPAVLLAPGPWSDGLLAELGIRRPPVLRTTRGTHVLFPGAKIDSPVISWARRDGRAFFLLPAPGGLLAGTTETDEGRPPEEVRPEKWEIEYMREEAESILGPLPAPCAAWTGIRPLVRSSRSSAPGAVSRRDKILADPALPGLFLVVGGKLTTHRAMARRAVDLVLESADRSAPPAGEVPLSPRPCRRPTEEDRIDDIDAACDLAPATLGDIVFRRTWFGLLPSVGPGEIEAAARRAASRLAWDEAKIVSQVRAALAEGRETYGRIW